MTEMWSKITTSSPGLKRLRRCETLLMLSGPKRAPMRKVPPVSKGAPTIAALAFSRSWTLGRRMNVRTPEKRGVSKESAGSYRVMDLFSLGASDAQLGGQRLEVGHHEIRLGVGRRGRPGPLLAGAPVHPDGGEPKLPGGHNVVEEALGGVQEPLSRNAHPGDGDLEVVGRGLVGAGLLGCDDPVDLHLEVAGGQREEAIVHVGDDGEFVPALEPPQRLDGVGEGLPVPERVRQRPDLLRVGLEAPPPPGFAHLLPQHLPVLDVISWRRSRLEGVLRLGVEREDLVVRGVDAVFREDGSQTGDYAALPVDQGPVAVEADNLVPAGVDQPATFPTSRLPPEGLPPGVRAGGVASMRRGSRRGRSGSLSGGGAGRGSRTWR